MRGERSKNPRRARGIRSSYAKEVMRLLGIPLHRGVSNTAGSKKSTKVLIRCIRKRDESQRECGRGIIGEARERKIPQ